MRLVARFRGEIREKIHHQSVCDKKSATAKEMILPCQSDSISRLNRCTSQFGVDVLIKRDS
jgi:hypothetical protein